MPGSREPERFVLVGGHYCAWHEGITDNATGDACVLEMAKLLWQERASLERSVRLCWWPGHSHGRYSGSTWYADTFFTDLAEGGLAYYNIDSPGVKGATAYYCRNTCAEFDGYCRAVIAAVTGQTNAPVFRPMRAADQSFLASGMPSFSAYPFLPDGHPDKRPWTGGCGNAWWWHTEHDTLDKADVSILATDVKVGLEAVWGLANATVPATRLSRDRAGVARRRDAASRPGPKAWTSSRCSPTRGRWPKHWSASRRDARRPNPTPDDVERVERHARCGWDASSTR